MSEIWKDVVGYEGLYQISSYGRCKSVDRYVSYIHPISNLTYMRHIKGKILKLGECRGYHIIGLCKNNIVTHFRINRLVATAFIPNILNLPFVNHIDEIKTNNYVENLEWCDHQYNINYGTTRKRIRDNLIIPIIRISKMGQIKEYNSISDVVIDGFSRTAVQNCLKGWSNTSSGYFWKYKS